MASIRQQHTSLLARPFKRKCTKRFYPDTSDHAYFRPIQHPVEPIKNKRLDMLALPNRFRQTPKYQEPDEASTYVPRSVLEANCTPRLDHLARPMVRVLEAIKKERRNLGKDFINFINDRIIMSLDTIYYHNVKSLRNIAAARRKNRARSTKLILKKKTWDEDGDKERMTFLAISKKRFPPTPPPPRKRKKLEEFKRIEKLSVPLHFYKRPSQESVIVRLAINPLALTCIASERVMELSKTPPWKLVKPWAPVAVKRSALLYNLSQRTKELSVPAPRARAVDNDLKENPYDINPFALTYKATPRIIELAKPIDR